MAEEKLKLYGLNMPWISDEGKSVLGLGSTTKIQRTIPFALWVKGGEAVPETMDSHQISGPYFYQSMLKLLWALLRI